MKWRHAALCLIALFALGGIVHADSEGQVWSQLLSQGKVGPGWRVWLETQSRYRVDPPTSSALLLRPALGWQASEASIVHVGYAWTPQYLPGHRDEHRIWGQWLWRFASDGFTFLQRARWEARLIAGVPQVAWRVRYLLRTQIPLFDKWSVFGANELFFNLRSVSPGIRSGFDQNRLTIGLNFQPTSEFGVDVGYLWNRIHRPAATEGRSLHVFQLSLYHFFSVDSPF